MPLAQDTAMSPEETDAFLGERETGVLSLARGNDPYAVPISYGYDADERTFYMRLVTTEQSEKRQFLAGSPRARLVIYESVDTDAASTTYRSVVAIGELEEIDTSDLSVEEVEQYGRSKRPLFEIWSDGKRDLDIHLYELRPEEISGRRTEVDWTAE